MNIPIPDTFSTRAAKLGAVFSATLLLIGGEPANAVTYDASADLLTMEQASATGQNPNGVWTYGGYQFMGGTFTPFTSAEHLQNWGSQLPATGGNGPFFAGEFQGYGFDTSLAIPSIVVNTTNNSLSPCCGISPYAPGEVFVHSAADGDAGAPQFNLPTFRFTAPVSGTADINALFTQKHSGVIPASVLLNGVSLFDQNTAGQNTSVTYLANNLALSAGDTLDFLVQGRASAAIDATIDLVPEPSSALLLGLGAFRVLGARRRKP